MLEVSYLHNSKLIKLLKTSDKKEYKRFEDYINSPFFNKNKEVIVLWNCIKKRLPNFSKPFAEKELLKIFLCTGGTISEWGPKEDHRLRILINRLTSLFCDFLSQQRRETEEVRNRRLLVDELMERKLYSMIPPVLKTANKLHDKNPYRGPDYYFDEYLISEADFFMNVFNKNRSVTSHPGKVIESLSNYAFSQLIPYCTAYINFSQIVNTPCNLPAIDKLIEYVETNKDSVSEIVVVYYHIYMMITGKEAEKHYYELREILQDFDKYLSKTPLQFIYGLMVNFCLKKIKKGASKFRLELYEIYQRSISLGVWGKSFDAHHYMEHLMNMLRLEKYEAAAEFQEIYSGKLQTKYMPDIPNLGYAYYHFHIGEHDKAQEYLNKVTGREDFMYTLYCKRLLIRIYYEKKEWTAIENALEAMRFYLLPNRSKDISEQNRNYNKNFLNVCKKIVRQRNNAEYNQVSLNILGKVKNEIKETEFIAERRWLLGKTEEIIGAEVAQR